MVSFIKTDLRHKLEKIKCRKLSKEEKKKFFAATQKFIERITSPKPEKQKVSTPSIVRKEVQQNTEQSNKRKPSLEQEEPAAKKRQVEKLDMSLAERLGTSPENRKCLAALKSPQTIKNCASPNLKDAKKLPPSSSPVVQKKKYIDEKETSPWEKKKTMPRLVTGKSFSVEPSPKSKRAAFEAMLDQEELFGADSSYCSSPSTIRKKSAVKKDTTSSSPASVNKDNAPKAKKSTPMRTPQSQQAPRNTWLSKSLGEKIFSSSESPAEIERLTKAKSAVKTKKRKSMATEEMVPCPMCNSK